MKSADREHDLYRARQFAALIHNETERLWPSKHAEFSPSVLVGQHNVQIERINFLVLELAGVLDEIAP